MVVNGSSGIRCELGFIGLSFCFNYYVLGEEWIERLEGRVGVRFL